MRQGRRLALALAATIAAAALGALGTRAVAIDLGTPRDLHAVAYAGSDTCRRCHPEHHASWRRTYHRTMTQEAREGAILGAFDGRTLAYGGWRAIMDRDRDRYRIRIARGTEEVSVHVIDRAVGSRRYQQYLERRGDAWWRLPIAWDVEEQRFFHMNAAFLTPDPIGLGERPISREDFERHVTRWNDNCVFCHNVAPNPGRDPSTGAFHTEVAELGIACEACHGPGAEHAARNTSPLRRYWLHAGDAPDPTIVSPARLDPGRRADLCGRCHGQRITDDLGAFLARGDPFVPGDALALYSSPIWHDTTLAGAERVFEPRFWGDGTARLTAYEYQGLLQSRCASEGALSCTDCHGMHEGDPRGQIRPSARGDAMCAGTCHRALASPAAALAHARHQSPIACIDCHMPRIVFGIRTVHRSHRIEAPRPRANAEAGRADACTLCHLERGPAWAERALAGEASSEVPPESPALLALGLGGDPIQRAIVLHAIGLAPPPATEPAETRARRLGVLVSAMRDDPYPALRLIAWRSLRALARVPLAPAAFDEGAGQAERARAIDAIASAIEEPVSEPDPALATALRARARQLAIEIGE